MRASAVAALAALLVPWLAGPARAGEQTVEVDGVRVTVSSHWPSTLNRGWMPEVVRVANPTGDERMVRLTFTCNSGPGSDTVETAVRVPAGGAEQFEIVLPARPQMPNGYNLRIEAGNRGYIGGIGAEQACPAHERIVLVASAAGPGAVALAGWATDLSAESAPRLPPDAAVHGTFGVRVHVGGAVAPAAAATGSAPAPDHVRVAGIAFENLSAIPDAYTSLHALVLDVGDGTPPPRAALDAATAWARTGGVLVVAGRGARTFLAKDPALAAWTEPRFRVAGWDGTETYVCGLGLLVALPEGGILADPVQVAALNGAIEARAPLDAPPPHASYDLPIPGIEVPFRPLTLLLVLFAILVGPVNLIVVRRSRRPALLLLTIPAIAIAFSLGLVVYGVLAQGLDVRATSSSVGVLDQRLHHGSSHERRQVFAGLATGPGLRPGPGAVVERVAEEALDWSARREYRAAFGDGSTLSGAWLPVRTPARFSVTVDRAARGRVDVERTPEGWKAVNGLDATVERLILRDAAGDLHRFQGPIAPGRAALADASSPDTNEVGGLKQAHVLAAELADGDCLPRGAWLARVQASPLLDACGLEYEEAAGEHVLLGILELEERR